MRTRPQSSVLCTSKARPCLIDARGLSPGAGRFAPKVKSAHANAPRCPICCGPIGAEGAEPFNPLAEKETALVQAIADTEWRIARIPGLEYGIYALARIEFASKFDDQPAEHRPGLIHAYTFIAYHKQLNNLSIQESRLNNQLVKIVAQLRGLQSQRQQQQQAKLAQAARHYIAANQARKPFNHKEFGFDFSMDQIDRYAKLIQQTEPDFKAA